MEAVEKDRPRPEPVSRPRKSFGVVLRDLLGPALIFVLFFGLWEVIVRALDMPAVILPAPSEVAGIFAEKGSYLLAHLVPTFTSILLGFALGVGGGFGAGVLIDQSAWVREVSYPYLVASQVIPKIALAPLFVVWFGYGIIPKVVMAALICFFPVVINTIRGFASVEPELVQFMGSLGASRWEIFRKLAVPWAMPYVFAAMKISMALAVIGTVVGEFVGSNRGLGYVIFYHETTLDTPLMFGALLLLSALGVALFISVVLAERYFVSWQLSVETPPETL
ncbi:MAG: ABC transporter permease [Nitrospinota bacterium]